MAWTAPRTWVTSEVVTAANMNTHVRDNLLWAGFHHGCRAWKSAAQTVASGNTDAVTWNSESYDTDAFHNTGSLTSRFVAPVSGYYYCSMTCVVDADVSHHVGRYIARIRKNAAGSDAGGTLLGSTSYAGHSAVQNGFVTWSGFLTAADYVEGFFNSSGENRDIVQAEDQSNFQISFMGF